MEVSVWVVYSPKNCEVLGLVFKSFNGALDFARRLANENIGMTYNIAEVLYTVKSVPKLIEEELCPAAK